MERVLKTAPVNEPISLTQTKLYLRIEPTDVAEDTLLNSLISAARAWVETDTDRALITQTWYLYLSFFPLVDYIELPFGTLQSIIAVKYTDSNNNVHTISASDYTVDTKSYVPKIQLNYGVSWPTATFSANNPIEIEAEVGYGLNPSDVPEPLQAACLQLVSHWYENRHIMADKIQRVPSASHIPMVVPALIAQYKYHRI